MSGQVSTATVVIKGVGDFNDVISNVGGVQKALSKLKLPDKLGDSLNKNIGDFYKEYDKYQKKISEGVKTQGDYNQVEKSLNNMRSLYQAIGKDIERVTKLDMKEILNLDTGEFKNLSKELTSIMKDIGAVKIDTAPFDKAFSDIRKITKSSKVTGDNGILNQMIGHIRTGQIAEAKKQLQELQAYANKVAPRTTAEGKRMPGTLSIDKYNQLTNAINIMSGAFGQADAAIAPLIQKQNELQKELDETQQKATRGLAKDFSTYNQASKDVDRVTDSLKRMHQEEFSFTREAQNIDRQIQSFFGLSQMIRKVGDIARDAFATVKELDAAMTQTAVVTNFSVGDMWNMLPTYTEQANQLGSTIKDVYEAATLYYQQGLNTNQAMGLANETLKMARIAGLDAAEATDMMTAALRGFNMEINQTSAQKINDVYSELAAITASDTQEIGSAMERTASIANSANMQFETTSAFLAQMIETTREAPENLGTAMKTIVARFQEMKQDPTKLIDSEGVAMDANKVDKALKTIGVQLMNTKGEFRDLDDVFLDISAKWDSLTQGQQRYIATIAAGSRQQSRFIAMMSNYERTMELVDAANNSAGASQRQFEKTLESMDSKLNKLKNAWDQFAMGLMNNQILKAGVDGLTAVFTLINKIIDVIGRIPPSPFEGITKSILTLGATLGGLQIGKKLSRGLVMGGIGWWKNEGSFAKNFAAGWGSNKSDAAKSGTDAGMTWSQFASKAINSSSGQIKQSMRNAMQGDRSSLLKNELTSVFQTITSDSSNFGAGEAGQKNAQAYIQGVISAIENGKISIKQGLEMIYKSAGKELSLEEMGAIESHIQQAIKSPVDFNKITTGFEGLAEGATKAGTSIQRLGFALQGTPLEGFGNRLIQIGYLINSVGDLTKTFGKNLKTAFDAAKGAEKGQGVLTFFKTLFPILSKIPPQALIAIAAITAISGAALAVTLHNKKIMETAQDAAAAASEAYDSAKQETSELVDSINKIKESEGAFDGLVVGTAEFNEQLIKTNQQITELLQKYPMLNDPKYLSTDKHGLMSINEEGFKAVQEYQKQRQANASALNIIQTADLNELEAERKAKQLTKIRGEDTFESYGRRAQEAEFLIEQAKAQKEVAKQNAVNTALVDKEIANREKVSAILADQYEQRKQAIKLEGTKHDRRQEYADFYGYEYDKSTKKMTDVEGNEIDFDDKVVKDALKDIKVIADLEIDANSLDKNINNIDSKISQALGDSFKGSEHLFSDILSSDLNIEDDLLQQLLKNPKQLKQAVDSLSEKEIAAVLGVSEDIVAKAPETYKNQLIDTVSEKATNIAETQAKSYSDLASMMAQTIGKTYIDSTGNLITSITEGNKKTIAAQLDKLTSEQKNNLSSIGKTLQESAGVDTMRNFIESATKIYTGDSEEAIKNLDSVIQGVNWDSSISRLKAYNDMIADGMDPSVQELGHSLLNSADSANLLGNAFEEMYDSSDFQDLAENMDKFADSSGKLNATSIQDMAKECGSLNDLLDTGAISAGGVAAALNALGSSGSLTIFDLNSNLLEFLSTANQLEDTLAGAHSLIENFDWGVDMGESEDFAKDSSAKWKELYENGEFGNQQLENYAKFVLGQERWNQELKDSGGNIETALDSMSKDILKYSDGFEQAWIDMANSNAKENQDVYWDENGDVIWETNGRTTEQMVKDLAEAQNITEDFATIMLEDMANYSYDLKTELASNDFIAALKNGDYITSRTGADGVNVTRSEIQALAAAQNKTEAEIEQAIAETVGIETDQLNVLENVDANGSALLDKQSISDLNQQYSKAELGQKSNESWLTQYQTKDKENKPIENTAELKTAISGAIADGFTADQATEMARAEAAKAFEEGTKVFYDGVELNKEDLESSEAFAARVAEITDSARWTAVGEAIAQGYISYISGKEMPNAQTTNDYYSNGGKEGGIKNTSDSSWTTSTPTEDPKEVARAEGHKKLQSFVQGLIEGAKEGPVEDPKIAAGQEARERSKGFIQDRMKAVDQGFIEAAQQQKTTGGIDAEVQDKIKTKIEQMWDGVKKAFSTPPQNNPDPKQNPELRDSQPQISAKPAKITVDNSEANSKLEETKQKGEEVKTAISGTVTMTISTPGAKSLSDAAKNAKKLKAVQGDTKIGVSASVSGTDKVQGFNRAAKEAQGLKSNSVSYTANVSGTSSVWNAVSAGQSFQSLYDKTVTYTTVHKTVNKNEPPSTGGYITSGGVLYRAKGGMAEHPAYPKKGTDRIPAYLTPGEYVQNRKAVQYFGIEFMRRINHRDLTGALQSFGSAARGSYGQLGPKGKGGMTLTGELGYEIAWIPSENRSMILGANGPQMIDLPSDAVVWTHEQSKKILKQQAIPAGSHAGRHIKGTSTGSGGGPSIRRKSSSSGGGGGNSGSSKAAEKITSAVLSTTAAVSGTLVWWDNIARRTEAIQRKADKNQKQYEKYIKKLQVTLKTTGTTGGGNNFITNTQKALSLYNAELKQATKELSNMNNGTKAQQAANKAWTKAQKTRNKQDDKRAAAQAKKARQQAFNSEQGGAVQISYSSKKGDKKETQYELVNTAGFIQIQDGAYVINQKALGKITNKERRKSLADALNKEINDRISKRNKAQDNIDKAKESLEKFSEELYNTFFAWETELTKIWNITQKIERAESKLGRQQSYDELLTSQIESGLQRATKDFNNKTFAIFKQQLKQETKILRARVDSIAVLRDNVTKALSTNDEQATLKSVRGKLANKKLSKTQRLGYQEYAKRLQEEIKVQNDARKYLSVTRFADGTLDLNFNTNKLEKDRLAGNITADKVKKIEDYVKKVQESVEELNNTYKEVTDALAETYGKLAELKDQWADYAKDLWEYAEEKQKEDIDNLKKLSSAISEALKKLIDEVKYKLDERRRKEDNAQTESDISKKQQRLAMLRADTSGSNRVEIARLEEEIAKSQQDYQRTLEDQLIDKLQRQADLAADQRERLIKLSEAQLEVTNNAALVDMWMANPEKFKSEILDAYRKNQEYDKSPKAIKEQIDRNFETFWNGLTTNKKEQQALTKEITNIKDVVKKIETELARSNITLGTAKANNYSVRQAQKLFDASPSDLRKVGKYTASDFVKAKYKVADLKKAGFSVAQAKKAGITNPKQLKAGGYTAKEMKAGGYSVKDLQKANYKTNDIVKAFGASAAMIQGNIGGKTVQNNLGTSAKTLQNIVNKSKKDKAVQADMVGVKTNIDTNGKKKGGAVSGTINASGKSVSANKGSTLYGQAWNTKTGKTTGKVSTISIGNLAAKHFKANKKEATEALIYAITHQTWGSKINKNFKSLVAAAGIAGKQYKLAGQGHNWYASVGANGIIYQNQTDGVAKWAPATGKTSLDKYNKKTFLTWAKKNNTASREYAQVLINKKAYTKAQLQKLGVKKFETGGLANFTGPAWLDGTSSKPELVLNAQDTKNFLMLKDVLSKAMSSAGSIENAYGGDANFEINISVDHINNDYDVDKITERIKRNILKDSSYRNVTQVRKFR